MSKQRLLASIDIFESDIVATSYTDNGKTLGRRMVDVEDLVKMLGGINKSVKWLKLSSGVVAVGTDVNGDSRYLVMRSAKKTLIRCKIGSRTRKYTMSLPSLLAELTRTKAGTWKKQLKVYAFRGKLKPETQLYIPPLPNMHEDGRVCMGSVSMAAFKDLHAAAVFEKAFIEPISTDDLTDSALAGKKYRNILDAIKKTGGKVPLNLLRKVKKYGEIFG